MRKLVFAIVLIGTITISGCALNKMVKMAEDQDLTVTPSPLELHGDSVKFEMSALLPVKMLKEGITYQVRTSYQYNDQELDLGTLEFKKEDYPNSDEEQPRATEEFAFAYEPAMIRGDLVVQGVAVMDKNGKSKETDEMPVAEGVITTSSLAQDAYYSAYAPSGYNNEEELIPVNIPFYFLQGSSVLRNSERRSDRGDHLEAYIADKNATKTVTITGAHSPEGPERVNANLSENRAEKIENFYRQKMRQYDYKGAADSIEFVLKPVVEDWTMFKEKLEAYEGLTDDEKSEILNIVDGSGSFEEKEDQLQQLSSYREIFREIYPELRVAKTEILKIKEKKSDAEINVLAQQIADGNIDADTLSDEELAYAATLTPSLDEKEEIYQAATKKNDSWQSHNNLGAVYLQKASEATNDSEKQENVEKALTQFEIALQKQESAEVYNNLAVAYLMQGNMEKAVEANKKSMDLSPSEDIVSGTSGVSGSLQLQSGLYTEAITSLSNADETVENTFNRGLAQLLNNDYQNALTSFEEAIEMENDFALAHYAAAVASARLQQADGVTEHLSEAVAIDPSLKEKAMNDLEFRDYADTQEFKDALK